MSSEQTTLFKPIKSAKPPEVVTIYGPEGTPHRCSPVDAREILASGNGYTAEAPGTDQPVTSVQRPIPADFPGALSLAQAGITDLSQLDGKTEAELTAIKGIGAATAKAILEAFAKLSFTES